VRVSRREVVDKFYVLFSPRMSSVVGVTPLDVINLYSTSGMSDDCHIVNERTSVSRFITHSRVHTCHNNYDTPQHTRGGVYHHSNAHHTTDGPLSRSAVCCRYHSDRQSNTPLVLLTVQKTNVWQPHVTRSRHEGTLGTLHARALRRVENSIR